VLYHMPVGPPDHYPAGATFQSNASNSSFWNERKQRAILQTIMLDSPFCLREPS
jgi:hypothetical protein